MPDPKALIFDLDGVITDTAEYHYLSWKRLADAEGLPFTRADNDQLRGVSRRESLIRLLKGKMLPEAQMEAWMLRKNDYYREFLNEVTPNDLLPGVGNLLNQATEGGFRIGLASASKNARDVLKRLGVSSIFGALGDGYSVVNSKPAPDLFIWVAGRLDVLCTEAVVFEDAEAGIEGALAAGMGAVGLGDADRVARAHVRLPNLDGANLAQILAKLAESGRSNN